MDTYRIKIERKIVEEYLLDAEDESQAWDTVYYNRALDKMTKSTRANGGMKVDVEKVKS